jgi:predicted nucleotidyltransferase
LDTDTEKSPFERIIDLLCKHGVQFVVIGGQAELLLGSARVTLDTDLCYRRSRENLTSLAAALAELKPSLRGAPPDLPFRLDAESLALGCNFTFRTTEGDLDLLGYVEPLGTYDDIAPRAESMQFGEITIQVASLDDLIHIKSHLGRPKDRESLMHLQAIKRIREEKV